MSEIVDRVAKALCHYPTGPSDYNSCCPNEMGSKHCQRQARAAIEAVMNIMLGATVSSSGLDITIACDDHDTKDAIFDALTGQKVP